MDSKRGKLTILFPDQDRIVYRAMSDETMHDLGLDTLCQKVTADPREQIMILQVMRSITPDPVAARYRADVFDDLYHHPEIREKLHPDYLGLTEDLSMIAVIGENAETLCEIAADLAEDADAPVPIELKSDAYAGNDASESEMINTKSNILFNFFASYKLIY